MNTNIHIPAAIVSQNPKKCDTIPIARIWNFTKPNVLSTLSCFTQNIAYRTRSEKMTLICPPLSKQSKKDSVL